MNEQDIQKYLDERRQRVKSSDDAGSAPPRVLAEQTRQALNMPAIARFFDRLNAVIEQIEEKRAAAVTGMTETPSIGDELLKQKLSVIVLTGQLIAYRASLNYLNEVLTSADPNQADTDPGRVPARA